MKTLILLFTLLAGISSGAQSLKDALFSGKLKSDTGMTVKKGDSLQLLPDSLVKKRADSIKAAAKVAETGKKVASNTISDTSSSASSSKEVAAALTNEQKWKQFIDEYSKELETEVIPSKKIKKGKYTLYIDYAIETDGSVSTVNIICVPENSYLVEQLKVRMMANAPQLSPVLMSNGKPRKALKKQVLTFVKEKD
ncbi:MAG: hypothetical protein B6D37_05090 [Sphingobacteriales bacterium UTBCD1]|jgi:hypothetical protein|nr:MAG: hypothetical protein B6D37_05090 [Sphingobacteriales bacterium UTBCD1]